MKRLFGAVARLFERYAGEHHRLDLEGGPIRGEDGAVIGRIEVVRRRWRRIEVEGWCLRADLRLDTGLGPPVIARRHARPLEAGFGDSVARPGFSVGALAEPDRAVLVVGGPGVPLRLPLSDLTRGQRLRGMVRLIPGFAATLLSVSPHLLRWLLHRDPEARLAVGRAFRDSAPGNETWLPDDLLLTENAVAAAQSGATGPVTIVLPVFNAFDLLGECLHRIEKNTDLPWHLVVVHDASTDLRVGPFLRDWTAGRSDRVTLVEHSGNAGFVAAANRGLAEAKTRDGNVVLLNSDAFVPQGWASRLLAPFAGRPEVASVTPMSNDAELLTVPRMSRRIDLSAGAADGIDAVARSIAPEHMLAEMPTGVGFCMALAPAWLARVPAFDSAFGRGYGEEVDWCLKTRALGALHLGHAGLFVEHRGGASFGGTEKLRRVQEAGTLIARRYPRFDAEVQRFLGADPLSAARLVLAVAWAGQACSGAVPVYIGHSLGGGAEVWLGDRVRSDVEDGTGAAIVIRVGGRSRWRVEVHGPWGAVAGLTDSDDLVVRLLAQTGNPHVIYSCGVGDADPAALPDLLLRFAGKEGAVSVLFHDYLPLSPSYTLLDADRCYRGVPHEVSVDPTHRARRPDGAVVTLAEWRASWKRLLEAAATRGEIVVFSDASRAIVAEAFPSLAASLVVRPHAITVGAETRVPGTRQGRLALGILGNLAPHKGAGVATELSRRLAAQGEGAPDLVLIGNLDPAYSLAPRHRCHGTYETSQIADLVRRYGITHWLIPSVWPETYSFTTREALATGLPVLCFDLGAQAEAVRAHSNGIVLPLCGTDVENADTALRALADPAMIGRIPSRGMDRADDSP